MADSKHGQYDFAVLRAPSSKLIVLQVPGDTEVRMWLGVDGENGAQLLATFESKEASEVFLDWMSTTFALKQYHGEA